MRTVFALPFIVLSACAGGTTQNPAVTVEDVTFNLFADQPFDTGPVTVLTAEHGDLNSYTLVLCRDGAQICSGSAHGRAGNYAVNDTHLVISGAYSGREFHLSPGGGGFLRKGGQDLPLAWDDDNPPSFLAVTRNWDVKDPRS